MMNECPLCKMNDTVALYKISSDYAARHFATLTNYSNYALYKKHIDNLWKSDHSEVIKCQKCGLIFAEPFYAGDDLFYSLFYDNSRVYPKNKWEFELTLSEMTKMKCNKITDLQVLEIGAGNGSFIVKLISKIGCVKKITCVENSGFSIKELIKLPISNVYKNLNDLFINENKEKYDFIFMFQVLEHMDNFKILFENINKILADNGCIFISVPNFYQRELFDSVKIYEDIPPMHVSRWNIDSFKYLAKKYCLEIANCKIQPEKYYQKLFKLIFFIKKNIELRSFEKNQKDSPSKIYLIMRILLKMLLNIRVFIMLKKKKYGTAFWIVLKLK